jgi:hypothetical protein
VFHLEFSKRVVLYNALYNALGTTVPSEILKLLFTLSAKTFVVAFYVVAEGCVFKNMIKKNIYTVRPGIGIDVTHIFDEYLLYFFNHGCDILELTHDFRKLLRQECVSLQELHLLTTF